MGMGQHTHTDDATPEMYCMHCGDIVSTNNSDEWVTAECARCGSVDLLEPYEAENQALIRL
jgi:Zn finger protein HypA/HybF involved in hydrogenase expression